MLFTKEEMIEIVEALSVSILDGFCEDDAHPIATAYTKAKEALHSYQ